MPISFGCPVHLRCSTPAISFDRYSLDAGWLLFFLLNCAAIHFRPTFSLGAGFRTIACWTDDIGSQGGTKLKERKERRTNAPLKPKRRRYFPPMERMFRLVAVGAVVWAGFLSCSAVSRSQHHIPSPDSICVMKSV